MGAGGTLTKIPKALNSRLGPKGVMAKNHFVAMVGEFIGTTMFLFFAFAGTQIANLNSNSPQPASSAASTTSSVDTSNLMFIALSFGFSLMINVWIFFRISGGLFNPAISLALALVKVITPIRAALLVVAQVLGGIAAAALVNVLLPGSLYVRTRLGGDISTVQGLFLEMFMTAELVFVVFMLAAEKHRATFLAPVGIGIALFMAELAGVYYTGGSLNPARSLGPDVVLHTFDTYHWIYWVGPILGALLATGLYLFMKVLDYEQVNGDQDKPEDEVSPPVRRHHQHKSGSHHTQGQSGPNRSKRPEFDSNTSSYMHMHGSHIPGRVGQPTLVDENRQVSSESRLSSEDTIAPQHVPELDNLNTVEQERKLSLPERMV